MGVSHIGDDRFFTASLAPSTDHDGGAVSVIRAEETAVVSAEFLESHPDVGLDVFDQMADVNMAVCVRQRGRDEDLTCH